jgi:hypothetical protein
VPDVHARERALAAFGERVGQRIDPGSENFGTIFFTCRSTKSTISPLKPSSSPMDVTTTWRTLRLGDHFRDRVREVLDAHQDFGARVVQLVLELARRVERIDVDDRAPARSVPNTQTGYCRMLGIITATRAPLAQPMPCSHAPNAVDSVSSSRERDGLAHARERRARAVLARALLEDLAHRRVLVDVDLGRDPFG